MKTDIGRMYNNCPNAVVFNMAHLLHTSFKIIVTKSENNAHNEFTSHASATSIYFYVTSNLAIIHYSLACELNKCHDYIFVIILQSFLKYINCFLFFLLDPPSFEPQ